jgi:hypothetical protein
LIEDILNRYEKIYPISIDLPGAGFGALLLTTLNQLRYCERNNLYPVILYDSNCKNAFFDENYGNNLWTQYFEPVLPFSVDDLENEKIPKEKIFKQTSLSAIKISEECAESIYTYPFGKWRSQIPEDLDLWYNSQRKKGRETVNKYIKINKRIHKKVEDYYIKNLQGSTILGIHIRGTDLHYAAPVSPAEYFSSVEKYLSEYPKSKIFIATDQEQYISVFQNKFGDAVYFSDCFRSNNDIAPFNRTELSPYQKGEDVLVDILILSKSDFLIKGSSNVGEIALYFNENLDCLDLGYKKIKAFGQRYDAAWDNMTNPTAWKLVSKSHLNNIAYNTHSQNKIQELYYEARKLIKRIRVVLGNVKRRILLTMIFES